MSYLNRPYQRQKPKDGKMSNVLDQINANQKMVAQQMSQQQITAERAQTDYSSIVQEIEAQILKTSTQPTMRFTIDPKQPIHLRRLALMKTIQTYGKDYKINAQYEYVKDDCGTPNHIQGETLINEHGSYVSTEYFKYPTMSGHELVDFTMQKN